MIKTDHYIRRTVNIETMAVVLTLYKGWYLWGFRFWSRQIDREDMPSWAFIALSTLGSSGWNSRLYKQYSEQLKG